MLKQKTLHYRGVRRSQARATGDTDEVAFGGETEITDEDTEMDEEATGKSRVLQHRTVTSTREINDDMTVGDAISRAPNRDKVEIASIQLQKGRKGYDTQMIKTLSDQAVISSDVLTFEAIWNAVCHDDACQPLIQDDAVMLKVFGEIFSKGQSICPKSVHM